MHLNKLFLYISFRVFVFALFPCLKQSTGCLATKLMVSFFTLITLCFPQLKETGSTIKSKRSEIFVSKYLLTYTYYTHRYTHPCACTHTHTHFFIFPSILWLKKKNDLVLYLYDTISLDKKYKNSPSGCSPVNTPNNWFEQPFLAICRILATLDQINELFLINICVSPKRK